MSLVTFAAVCIRPGDTVFDVGANSAYFSRVFAAAVRPGGRVYAIEPNPNFDDELAMAAAEYEGILSPHCVALTDHLGEETLYVDNRSTALASTLNAASAAASRETTFSPIRVRCLTLDAFCADRRLSPAFIKLDAEGSEPAIFAGGIETLTRARPLLWLEYSSGSPAHHLMKLVSLGYRLFLGCVIARDGEWIARTDDRNPRALLPLDTAVFDSVGGIFDLAAIPEERVREATRLIGRQSADDFLRNELAASSNGHGLVAYANSGERTA
jgi:FkbM family methyltransferase